MKGIDIFLVILFIVLWIAFGFVPALIVSAIASFILLVVFKLGN